MKRFLPLIIFGLLAVLLAVGLTLDPKRIPSPLINKPAPAFELPTLMDASATIGLEDFKGKVSLLNIWATWCFACRQEHPVLNAIAQTGIIDIYGLNWKDERVAAIQLLQASGNPYTEVAFDQVGDVAIDFGVYGAPETFLIDKKGTIRHKVIGPIDQKEWEDTLKPMIAKLNAES